MTVVLGVDAAWTLANPSGVALIEAPGGGRPRLLRASPSYGAFMAGPGCGDGVRFSDPPVLDLLRAAEMLAAAPVDVIAVDMPLATRSFTGRRNADNAISRAFGAAGCGTHSPGAERPGPISEAYTKQLAGRGFRLATAGAGQPISPALIEVYPHVALLRLCKQPRRLTYKISRCSRYWPAVPLAERKQRLLAVWEEIRGCLAAVIDGVETMLPAADPERPLAALKAYEDTLDAVVCAWVGLCYARGRAECFGDEEAAIWVPRAAPHPEPVAA